MSAMSINLEWAQVWQEHANHKRPTMRLLQKRKSNQKSMRARFSGCAFERIEDHDKPIWLQKEELISSY